MFYWKTFDVQNGILCFNAYLIQKAWLGDFGSSKKDQSALKNKTKQNKTGSITYEDQGLSVASGRNLIWTTWSKTNLLVTELKWPWLWGNEV